MDWLQMEKAWIKMIHPKGCIPYKRHLQFHIYSLQWMGQVLLSNLNYILNGKEQNMFAKNTSKHQLYVP